MKQEQISAIRKVAGWLLALAWLWAICNTIQDWSAMNDRYGEFRGEVFWDFIFSNLYDAILLITVIFIFNAFATVIECLSGKDETEIERDKDKINYTERVVKAMESIGFCDEISEMPTHILQTILLCQKHFYTSEEIAMIENQIILREETLKDIL